MAESGFLKPRCVVHWMHWTFPDASVWGRRGRVVCLETPGTWGTHVCINICISDLNIKKKRTTKGGFLNWLYLPGKTKHPTKQHGKRNNFLIIYLFQALTPPLLDKQLFRCFGLVIKVYMGRSGVFFPSKISASPIVSCRRIHNLLVPTCYAFML